MTSRYSTSVDLAVVWVLRVSVLLVWIEALAWWVIDLHTNRCDTNEPGVANDDGGNTTLTEAGKSGMPGQPTHPSFTLCRTASMAPVHRRRKPVVLGWCRQEIRAQSENHQGVGGGALRKWVLGTTGEAKAETGVENFVVPILGGQG